MITMVGSKSLSSPVHRDVWAACHVQGSVVGQCDQGLNNYHIFLIAAQYHPVHRSSPQDIPQGIGLRTVAVDRCDCQHLDGPPERFRSKSLSVSKLKAQVWVKTKSVTFCEPPEPSGWPWHRRRQCPCQWSTSSPSCCWSWSSTSPPNLQHEY